MNAILPDHLEQLETELKILGIVITAFVVLFGIDLANPANAPP